MARSCKLLALRDEKPARGNNVLAHGYKGNLGADKPDKCSECKVALGILELAHGCREILGANKLAKYGENQVARGCKENIGADKPDK